MRRASRLGRVSARAVVALRRSSRGSTVPLDCKTSPFRKIIPPGNFSSHGLRPMPIAAAICVRHCRRARGMKTKNRRRTVHAHSAIFFAGRMRVQRFARTTAEPGDFRLPVHRADNARRHLSRIVHWWPFRGAVRLGTQNLSSGSQCCFTARMKSPGRLMISFATCAGR